MSPEPRDRNRYIGDCTCGKYCALRAANAYGTRHVNAVVVGGTKASSTRRLRRIPYATFRCTDDETTSGGRLRRGLLLHCFFSNSSTALQRRADDQSDQQQGNEVVEYFPFPRWAIDNRQTIAEPALHQPPPCTSTSRDHISMATFTGRPRSGRRALSLRSGHPSIRLYPVAFRSVLDNSEAARTG